MIDNNLRDKFNETTKKMVARKCSYHCSNPSCQVDTIGSNKDGDGEINRGVAAHICARAPGGSRYDPEQRSEQRKSPENCIWLCQNCAKIVDDDPSTYTVQLLHEWKKDAQNESYRRVASSGVVTQERQAGQESENNLVIRLHAAAEQDLDVFRRSHQWPDQPIMLGLKVIGREGLVDASALGKILIKLENLILVSPPGTGKTTTLFQIADGILNHGKSAVPIIIQMGEWSVDNVSLLDSVLKRPAFQEISENDFRAAAALPSVALLLDGWNELDDSARQRASTQINRLQRQLPELSLLVATRKQALNVPIEGTRVEIQPLNESQQLEISRSLPGNTGKTIIDRARGMASVRELMTIPLYFKALLAFPEGESLPDTKEKVLSRFVDLHEEGHQRIEALNQVMHGLHRRYLEELSVTATRNMNTSLADSDARQAVSAASSVLTDEGQIAKKPEPRTVLETLVNHQILICTGVTPSFSFQHQQFQEWYASCFVETLMIECRNDVQALEKLKSDVLNKRAWENAVLFACERLSRGDAEKQEACASAISAAFYVDPALAAEMVYHSTDAVWEYVGRELGPIVSRWHTPGIVDRAARFMLASGSEEFSDYIWSLISHEKVEVALVALASSDNFRPSVLGNDAERRVAALPQEHRLSLLREIVFQGDIGGLDFVVAVAKNAAVPEIKAAVASDLAHLGASRHVIEVLQDADQNTFSLLAHDNLVHDLADEPIKAKLVAAQDSGRLHATQTYERMVSLVNGPCDEDRSEKLATAIAEIEISERLGNEVYLIREAKRRFPSAVIEGIVRRLREGLTLPFNAGELMADSGLALEDETLLSIALDDNTNLHNDRANVAASVLGPVTIGRMIDEMFEGNTTSRHRVIRERLNYTQPVNLFTAIKDKAEKSSNQELAGLADLVLSRPIGEHGARGRPFNTEERAVIAGFTENWSNRLFSSPATARTDLASMARLACCSSSASLLPLLKRLLDEELNRWRGFKKQAHEERYQSGTATNEARMSWMLQYQWAFLAINCPETTELMCNYLLDEDFGHNAALVLAEHWRSVNEPSDDKLWRNSPDFSRVAERRATRTANPDASSEAADAIFCTIERLISPASTDAQKKHAVALAIVGAALPHGQRKDIIEALINIADGSQINGLLTSLVLSGKDVDVGLIKRGITDLLEAAQTEPWLLTEPYRLLSWLRLLPFSNNPSEIPDIVRSLPEQYRTPDILEDMVNAMRFSPGDDVEDVLFQIAKTYPRLYRHYVWREAVLEFGTLSSAKRLVDLISQGMLGTGEEYPLRNGQLADLINEHSGLRAHVYALLQKARSSPGTYILAQAVAERPDENGFFLLIELGRKHNRNYIHEGTIERMTTKFTPSQEVEGAFNIIPVPANSLRRRLLDLTTDGGPSDVAAQYLNQVDEARDRYGAPESEPRHPDLASGKAWPVIGGPETGFFQRRSGTSAPLTQ